MEYYIIFQDTPLTGACAVTDPQYEFRRLCSQLEQLKQRDPRLGLSIRAMLDAASHTESGNNGTATSASTVPVSTVANTNDHNVSQSQVRATTTSARIVINLDDKSRFTEEVTVWFSRHMVKSEYAYTLRMIFSLVVDFDLIIAFKVINE